ncbi:hypothetical protein [Methylobacterium sp. GC_Met_2]|uniref:hypothetical protein n=1 Tax=Methylobacterium sp. GC_Met_2 TaxID=2937376 RepID=UPI00226B4627|nr:hypothetical protein [Methylobacterium sp. GC_Met_2]
MMRRPRIGTPPRAVPPDRSAGAPSTADTDVTLPETMTVEERAAVRRGLSDVQAGHLATEAEIEAAFRRFRP